MEHGISEEFKVRAVGLLEEARYNARFESGAVKTVASSLAIAQETLRRWSKSQDGLALYRFCLPGKPRTRLKAA